jgi:predicted enzyme related to lactoylglutathione lyase
MVSEPRVTGLGGVFFKAKDSKTLGDWYRTHLGMPVEDGGFAVLRWREHDEPSRVGSTVWAVFDETTDYLGGTGQRAMINYRVADLDAVLAALRSEGVSVDDHVQADENGRFGWITDPEGNRIELWQPPEGS